MKIYNTLTHKKEEFVPVNEGKVGIYACGPTVYDFFHLGNARAFVVFDTLRKYFEFSGYEVNFVQNFTDIDDKMINRANEQGITVKQLGDQFINEYFHDAGNLGVQCASCHPRATESIDDIISLIKKLVDNGHAYDVEGDVYFDITTFPEYGKLSRHDFEGSREGVRIALDDRKKHPGDFALWKAAKPGEPSWTSPWGEGRPGWHIECSAMALAHIGETIDIHCGGEDLIFPHHENEIAQSEACTGKQFARYWMHNGFINVDNEKMSKSLGNFFTVRELAKKYDYEVIRFLILGTHYRKKINFDKDLLEQAQVSLARIHSCYENLEFMLSKYDEIRANEDNSGENYGVNIAEKLEVCAEHFKQGMDDDLNTTVAITALFEGVKEINTNVTLESNADKDDILAAMDFLKTYCGVLGLLGDAKKEDSTNGDMDETEINALIEQRQQARKEKNWGLADKIRDDLKEMGIVLEDTSAGVKWKKA